MESSGSKRSYIVKSGVVIVLFIIAANTFRRLMGQDFTALMRWWAALLLVGLGFMPLTMTMFKRFRDKGWLFSKTIGVAVSAWVVWFLSSAHIVRFTVGNCFILTAVCIVCNVFLVAGVRLFGKNEEGKPGSLERTFGKFDLDTCFSVLMSELVFFTAFAFWSYLRCFKPEILGTTEKFMDYGLMTSIDRAMYMPAEDIWLSGNPINYYYLGQYIAVFIKRISGVEMKDAYTLALMMIAGFATAMPYSIMNQVAGDYIKKENISTKNGRIVREDKPQKWYTQLIGLFAGISVCFAGNMHYTIVDGLVINGKMTTLRKLLSIERESYWFPDATRYIGYTPDTNDKTIHEFPSYSFVLGDLHAHVINIMFVLTVVAILYTILQYRKERMDSFRTLGVDSIEGFDIKKPGDIKKMLLTEILTPQVFLLGFFIGFFHMTNFWDFPIYFVVSGAIILFSNAVICRFRKETLIMTAAHAVVILAVSTIVSLPFTLKFDQISTGIGLSLDHTPLYQLFVLWGLPITVVITFLVALIRSLNKKLGKRFKTASDKKKNNPNRPSISKFCDEHPGFDWLYRFISSLEISDLFVITLGLCAVGLILMPELIYVKDIYSGSYKRANTMFKLTYQAFIMFGMCMPYIIGRFLRFGDFVRQRIFAAVAFFLLMTTFGYFFNAAHAWFGDYADKTRYKGLDCVAFLKDYYPEDLAAAEWINENIEGEVHILEAVGYSYTYYGRVAVLTGSTTPIGWETHEWLWRSSANFDKPAVIPERQADIKTVYSSDDAAVIRQILNKYDIDYLYVGEAERYDGMNKGNSGDEGYFRNTADGYYYAKRTLNDSVLRSLGEVVYQATDENGNALNPDGTYRTYIVKVK